MRKISGDQKRLAWTIALCLAAIVAIGGFSAAAQTLPQSVKKQTGDQLKLKSNKCASYGPGFKPVGDSSTCIKIGGRVQFEMMVRPGSNTFRTR